MQNKWVYCKRDNCYLIGTSDDGCGVYWEGNGYTGHAVVGNEMASISDYPTLEDAKEAVLELWTTWREKLGMGAMPATESNE